jgi:hypothetical protein
MLPSNSESGLFVKDSLSVKFLTAAGYQWLTPVILATLEAEIGRIKVQDQLGQIVPKTPFPKHPQQNGLEAWLKCRAPALPM